MALTHISTRSFPHRATMGSSRKPRRVALASLSLLFGVTSAQNCTMDKPGVSLGSGAITTKSGVASASACCAACDAEPGCVAFTFEPAGSSGGVCYMKDNTAAGTCSKPSCISGTNGKKPSPHPHHPPGPPHPHPPPPALPPAPPAAEQLKDLATLRARFFDFYLDFGDCTQTQFCMQGSYMLYQDGTKGTCAVTCTFSEKINGIQIPQPAPVLGSISDRSIARSR